MTRIQAKSTQPPTSTLPPELYSCILDFVLQRCDLLSLSLVSRAFHQEAERALYRYIDLSYDHRLTKEWFSMIALNPRLADMVRSVTFGMIYSEIPTPSDPWLAIIKRGLHALTHLTEYVLANSIPVSADMRNFTRLDINLESTTSLPPSYTDIILGHPFRLKVFRNTMFDLTHTLPFLTSQPNIVIWHQPVANICNLPSNLLPELSQAALPPWLIQEIKTRPLVELSTTLNTADAFEELAFLDTLSGFRQTLTRLCLQRLTFKNRMPLRDFLLHLSACLPRLQHLGLWNRGELVSDSLFATFSF